MVIYNNLKLNYVSMERILVAHRYKSKEIIK